MRKTHMPRRFRFDPEKALEVILYVVRTARTDKYGTLKLLYLADKLHLQRYGRFIAGDYYHALENGPTPMLSYDLIQFAAGEKQKWVLDSVRDALGVGTEGNPHALLALREPDLDALSDSDIECLDEVIRRVENVDPKEKYRLMWADVHDNAWSKAWRTNQNGHIDVEAIAEQFPNAAELIEYLREA